MEKILGIDLGTNSIGLTLREDSEFPWYGVYTFKKGVGEGKSGEFSFAAERTKHRASRRLYNARRYRKWETLRVLISSDFCPLSEDTLNKWKHYQKGIGRVFPVNNIEFNQWIKLDFNMDGVPDFRSPYQLRKLLISDKLDLTKSANRYTLGRALYHIAQRRGFRSSRKNGANEETAVYKGSNETKTIGRNDYEELILKYGSLGAALAYLEEYGIRVRNRYTLRSDYYQEVSKILDYQNVNMDFAEKILKAIFFQRPLRSQKGLIGKCTLEPNKPRCPINHPRFEEYRAWSFLNNIKFRDKSDKFFKPLPLELKQKIFTSKFFYKSKREFQFSEIRKMIKDNGGGQWELNYDQTKKDFSLASCYVSARLKSAFGESWKDFRKTIEKLNKRGETEKISYTIEDIWHILFSFEDEEYFSEFLTNTLNLTDFQVNELLILFKSFPVGYANLSLKAINKILPFLKEGYIYSEAVILAKIPDLIGMDLFKENNHLITSAISDEIERNRYEKTIVSITNALIYKYYSLDYKDRFGWKDTTYKLNGSDFKDIETTAIEYFGNATWNNNLSKNEHSKIIEMVAKNYQAFFADIKREHVKAPHLVNQVKEFLRNNFDVEEKKLNQIYHPSQNDIYPSYEDQIYLQSPRTAAFKNPMAYKTLYQLRDVLNYLIKSNKIDRNTRIVIEIARDLNDRNKRWAIETYQRRREAENLVFKGVISELINDKDFKGFANPESSEDIDKFRLFFEQIKDSDKIYKSIGEIDKNKSLTDKDIQKYRLWKEQGCRCIYTGRIINLTDLFDQNRVDFEHTIPRSKSFDNSLANLTVCYSNYNRDIKKNKLPVELPNYDTEALGYSPIKPRLEPWEKKIDDLEKRIDSWKIKSKNALDKDEKDYAIRQRHLCQMELDYWRNKVDRFQRAEIPQGFINSQLVDTQIITKYAFHYLKTVFSQVDVIKGSNTAEFRKIFGIQPKTEKKNRTKHYHHAIDAAVLTLIPSVRKREEILKRYYDFEEQYNNMNKQYHEKPFSSFNNSMIEAIKKNILINNIPGKNQTLTPSKRLVRKRGRIVWLDKKKQIPKIAQGDSIRGELHQQTFYSKIRLVEKDENNKPKRDDDGKWKFLQGEDEYRYALRRPVEDLTSLEKLVSPELATIIKTQLNGRSLKKAITDGLFMLDKNGNKVNKIRKVRVWEAVDPMPIKEQTYKSTKEYKNYYYAKNAENTAFGFYRNEACETAVIPRNLFDISTFIKPNSIKNINQLFEQDILSKRGNTLTLIHVLIPGMKVLFYENAKEELSELECFSNHLYYVRRLYEASSGRIQFQHHLEARDDKQLTEAFPEIEFGKKGINGFSKFTTEFIAPRSLVSG